MTGGWPGGRGLGLLAWLAVAASGCGDSDAVVARGDAAAAVDSGEGADTVDAGSDARVPPADGGAVGAGGAELDELLALGIDEFLGAAEPTGQEMISGVAGVVDGSIVYDFDPDDGPVCLRGAPFHMSVLDQGSDDLVIFMQGGGACVSLICSATTMASPRGVPQLGVLDPSDADNPVADWNIVYVPYCDGSVFAGDNDFDNPNDAMGVRLHHGQRNFAAALDRALEHFPHPSRVLLAGSSAGGWGTVYHRALVRHVYPDAELSVMNDAGIGLQTNLPFVADEWGSTARFRPPSCADCQSSAHMLPFVRWYLEHDPDVVVGDFSSWEDSVIQLFAFVTDPMAFRELIQIQTDIPASAFPDRYKRFIIEGTQHTSLMRGFHTTQIDGVSVAEWLGWMIERDPRWVDMLQ